MRHVVQLESNARRWPDPWQMALVAICSLILCSCRAPIGPVRAIDRSHVGGDSLPAAAYTDMPQEAMPAGYTELEQGPPMPYSPQGSWSPPGIAQPWPENEYVRDGGDQGRPAGVTKQGEVLGLGMEDTVAHFDTLDGKTVVEPSNEVRIYCPRFGAVRQVVGVMASEEHQRAGGVHEPLRAEGPTTTQIVANAKQNVQLDDQISARPAAAMRTKQGDGLMSNAVRAKAFQDEFKPFENLSIIRMGAYQEAETAFLARGSNAAIAWSHNQAVQIIIDGQKPMADVKYDDSLSVYTVASPPGKPKLRLVKVASTAFAQPGDTIDFTLRFDNVGNERINHVTILDSLSTRLEFMPDSAQCSVDAKFTTRANEGDSVVVRCELTNPLDPAKGGVLRFRCRVR